MAEKAIDVYAFQSPATGEQLVGVWPRVNHPALPPTLRRLGFRPRDVSGKKAAGGPGVRQHRIWVMSLTGYHASALAQAELKLLLAEHNPGPPGDPLNSRAILHWRQVVATLKKSRRGAEAQR